MAVPKNNQTSNIKTPNVLLVSLHADPIQPSGSREGGGTHAYIRELLRTLSYNRCNASVVTRHADIELPAKQYLSEYASIYRIKLGKIAPIDKRLLNGFHNETVDLITQIINALPWKPSVLHGVYWNSGRAAMTLASNLGIPYVQTVISNGKRRVIEGFQDNAENRIEVETEVYRNAATVFCISTEERNDLINLYGVEPEKIKVVGRPIPLTFLQPPQLVNGEPRNINLHSEGGFYGQ